MTPTQLKEAAQVMVAASEGKQVQYMALGHVRDVWVDITDPSWDWTAYSYRIKPDAREWWLDLRTGRVCLFFEINHCDVIKVREVIE